jgi:Mn2+/Fe2+ NRAMP family transporter
MFGVPARNRLVVIMLALAIAGACATGTLFLVEQHTLNSDAVRLDENLHKAQEARVKNAFYYFVVAAAIVPFVLVLCGAQLMCNTSIREKSLHDLRQSMRLMAGLGSENAAATPSETNQKPRAPDERKPLEPERALDRTRR